VKRTIVAILVVLGCLLGAGVGTIGGAATGQWYRSVGTPPPAVEQTSEADRRKATIQAAFENSARELLLKLPMKLDEITTLTKASVDGTKFIYDFTIDISPPEFDQISGELVKKTREFWCNADNMATITSGGIVVYRYVDKKAEPVGQFTINACS
jgi:hypothetical protein